MNRDEHHNSELFLRPRFSIECTRKPSEVLQTVLQNIENIQTDYKTKISDNHVFIDVADADSHFWSPQLHFKIEEEQEQTKIRGLFGPKPQVWTLFIFIHFAVAMTFIAFAILFYVNIKLDTSVVFPVVMLVALPIVWFLLYFLGQIGKEKGKKQMDSLKEHMRNILENVH